MLCQFVACASGAPTWFVAITAWSWNGPGLPHPERALDDVYAVHELLAVPERAVLLLERDELAVRARTGLAARVGHEHEREQAEHLGLIGHQLGEQPAEADRLAAEVGAHELVALGRGVALVEHEVDDVQHGRQPLGQQVSGRHAVRDLRVVDLALRAHQPLCHRRLRDEERASDLARLQARDRAQRQRQLRLRRERGVAAGEDQAQPVVFEHPVRLLGGLLSGAVHLLRRLRRRVQLD